MSQTPEPQNSDENEENTPSQGIEYNPFLPETGNRTQIRQNLENNSDENIDLEPVELHQIGVNEASSPAPNPNPRSPGSKIHPLTQTNPVTYFFFWWVTELIWVTGTTQWTQSMHYDLPEEQFSIRTHKRCIQAQFRKSKKRLYRSLCWLYRYKLAEFTIMMIVCQVIELSYTVFLARAFDKISSNADLKNREILTSFVLDFVVISISRPLSSFLKQIYYFDIQKIKIQVNMSLYSILAEKIMKFNVLTSEDFSEGFLANLVQIDATEVAEMFRRTTVAIERICIPAVAIAYMFVTINRYSLIVYSLAIWIGMKSLSAIILYFKYRVQKRYMAAKDARMTTFRNIMQNLEYIKINGLENWFSYDIFWKREQEIRFLQQNAWVFGMNRLLTESSNALALFCVFCLFYFDKGDTTFGRFSSFITLYNRATFILHNLVYIFVFMANSWASVERVNRFLASELSGGDGYVSTYGDGVLDGSVVLKVGDGCFRWKEGAGKRIEGGGGVKEAGEGEKGSEVPGTTLKNETSRKKSDAEDLDAHNRTERGVEDRLLSKPQNAPRSTNNENNDGSSGIGGSARPFELKNIDLEIHKGETVVVIGKSNSGKSSLLYALIGEMLPGEDQKERLRPMVWRKGSLSYLSQKRWLMGDTVKENICIGKEYEQDLMVAALEASQLSRDMDSFKNGVETVVSDSSDTISGGQRARIGLARCFYQDSDIMILDDPTSSLDNKVATRIMKIMTRFPRWKDKTVIFSTNNLRLLDYCDKAILMDAGRVSFFGKVKDLRQNPAFAELKTSDDVDATEGADNQDDHSSSFNDDPIPASNLENLAKIKEARERSKTALSRLSVKDNLFIKEDRKKGAVSLKVISRTIRGMGGTLLVLIIIGCKAISSFFSYYQTKSRSEWGIKFFQDNTMDWAILQNFLLLALGNTVMFTIYTIFIMIALTWLMRSVHCNMIFRLLHANLTKFIQRTPLGVVMNRVSFDINVMDVAYPTDLQAFFLFLIKALFDIYGFVVEIKAPYALIPVTLYLIMCFKSRNWYMRGQRDIQRLLAITKSPVIGLASATIPGGAVIRSMRLQRYVQGRVDARINENTKNMIFDSGLKIWFDVINKLWEMFVLSIPLYSILIFVVYRDYVPDPTENQKKVRTDLSNFLVRAISFAGTFATALDYICSLELQLVSAERCETYENIEPENGYSTFSRDQAVFSDLSKQHDNALKLLENDIHHEIFKSGFIDLKGVFAKYPTSTRNVIDGVTLSIKSGQKVGVVGRTGAGKSSFTKLLWRALEPSRGSIEVDGLNLKFLDLKEMRRELNIVLQKPSLFEGTLESNISQKPLRAAEISRIKEELLDLGFPASKIEKSGLGYKIESEGKNLSQSEKQIVSMVQSLQRETRVVILDEATAYVDARLEGEFQRILMERFKEATVFVIAHRISNVMGCDRVLVFDQGRVVQDGAPEELLGEKSGIFYSLWKNN